MHASKIVLLIVASCALSFVVSAERPSSVSQLPDPKNAADLLALRCSACKSSSKIMQSHLSDALFEFQHHPIPDTETRHQLMGEAVRGTCQHEQRLVGLLRKVDSPKVQPIYQHELLDEYSGDLVKAAWITSLWTEECQEVETRMKPHFLEHALGNPHGEWCPVCTEEAASTSRTSSHDEL
ncbi:Hypothetical protein, putative [Bodo saltans]|uniref:Membrane-associated protein n=1 Tax=Bodo saltans TaxID=75058 RepID=A0A0S4JNY4_BODSA|nr:Hypothetical protein, putative [Bodo saltans]|eukprot:CUG91634.1 Hypothetical protein, putative [Bodo saltans]